MDGNMSMADPVNDFGMGVEGETHLAKGFPPLTAKVWGEGRGKHLFKGVSPKSARRECESRVRVLPQPAFARTLLSQVSAQKPVSGLGVTRRSPLATFHAEFVMYANDLMIADLFDIRLPD
jgi:hypothetical protein